MRRRQGLVGQRREHVTLHGAASPPALETLRCEPSLTLCSPRVFARFGGRLAAESLLFMLDAGALDEAVKAVRGSADLSIRISSYTLWLEEGQVPSSRYDWHIDRIGAISGSGTSEMYDVTDYSGRRSFAVLSHFITGNQKPVAQELSTASTEFVLRPAAISLPDGWLMTQDVQRRIETCLAAGYESARCGNGVAAAFSARAIHRPGIAPEPGWRFMIRAGAYRTNPPCSPYLDHIPAYNPFCVLKQGGHRLRPVGEKMDSAPAGSWSYPDQAEEDIFTMYKRHGLLHDLRAGSASESIENAIAKAC